MIKRAVIYARVSTDEQSGNYSLPIQRADGRRYAAQHGWHVIGEVEDDCSGGNLDRPGLRRVRDLIREGQVDVLIVHAMDRLTRSLADLLSLREEFMRAGVELHYVKRGRADDTPSGILLDNIEAVIGQYERTRLLERMADGRRGKVAEGKVPGNGPPPYGYRYVGQQRERHLEIDENEAEVVRCIFIWYVTGNGTGPLSAPQIAELLAARNIPTRADRTGHVSKQRPVAHWNPEFIRVLLHNPVYYGVFYAYRYRKTEDKRQRRRPREDWVGVPVPAIITRDLWDAAQERLSRGKQLSPRNSQADRYLLRCRIRCQCGYAWIGDFRYASETPYYVCSGRKRRRVRVHSCDFPYIHGPRFDAQIWTWIETTVLEEAALAEALQQYQERTQSEQARIQRDIKHLEQQLAQLDTQLGKLVNLFLTDGIDRVHYDTRRAELIAAQQVITTEIAQRQTQTSGLTDEEVMSLQSFAQIIREELRDLNSDERRRIVDMLDVRVTIARENEQLIAHVCCRLAPTIPPVGIDTSIPPG